MGISQSRPSCGGDGGGAEGKVGVTLGPLREFEPQRHAGFDTGHYHEAIDMIVFSIDFTRSITGSFRP
jgi:hypothetical protein